MGMLQAFCRCECRDTFLDTTPDRSHIPTLTGMEAAGFKSAAYFYYAARELAEELAAGADLATARATVAQRCKVDDAQLDYILSRR
jgi:hypothetical protein